MKITLLTHEKEMSRKDNSGKLCFELSGIEINTVVWQRKAPDSNLLEALKDQALLITPNGGGDRIVDIDHYNHFVLLDSTWQEARKMYNRSDYLKSANWFAFDNPPTSRYNLRRNQIDTGLCTAECVIELLKLKGKSEAAQQLEQRFLDSLN